MYLRPHFRMGQMVKWNINRLCRTKKYMGQIMAECDCQSQLCEDRGYCIAETPSPEAIVRTTLERAAKMGDECQRQNGPLFKRGFDEPYRRGLEAGGQAVASAIRHLASNPSEVAAIIKKAWED